MECHYWSHWQPGMPFPGDAVQGGVDCDGSTIYVGRAQHGGDLIPAKVIPEKDAAYIAYGGDELFISGCEVMCKPNFLWVPCSGGQVPPGAIPVGQTGDGETLYAGRVFHEGSHTIGKVHPSHNTCYIPFGGKEISHEHYEVLVMQLH